MNISPTQTGLGWPSSAETTAPVMNRPSQQPSERITTTEQLKLAELQGRSVPIGEEQLIKAIEKANKALVGKYTSFEFSIHEGTKQIMVKVLDRDTGEMIREIPPEKILDMVAKMWELAGILIDERR